MSTNNIILKNVNSEDSDEENNKIGERIASYSSVNQSISNSVQKAGATYSKPTEYTGNRKLYDNGAAKAQAKRQAFSDGKAVYDPYTNNQLELKKSDAKLKYGDDWTSHLAEADHITPIEKIFDDNSSNPWLTNSDIRDIANNEQNIEVVSRKYNNAKRSRTNEEFVSDEEYLNRTGVNLNDSGKQTAIEHGKQSQLVIDKKVKQKTVQNALVTGHEAGLNAAYAAGSMTAAMSVSRNLVSIINGDKDIDEALADTAKDTGKAVVYGYLSGNGLTVLSHSLSNSSSDFLRTLAKSNVPANIISGIMEIGGTLKKLGNGEITVNECFIELGEKGVSALTTPGAMAIGQTLIPIPVVGAAIGALVGSAITSDLYHHMIFDLERREMEHQERLRIISECEKSIKQIKQYRVELNDYLDRYFYEYGNCFDTAMSNISQALKDWDANALIYNANQITRKLGGNVYYDNMDEFDTYLNDGLVDIL